MDQCSILFIASGQDRARHPEVLRSIGFHVHEVEELPESSDLVKHHVVIVSTPQPTLLPKLAARLRAAPRFGRRLLLALIEGPNHETLRREGLMSGFDDVLSRSITGRQLAAAILNKLRSIPEYRCLLAPLTKRPPAA